MRIKVERSDGQTRLTVYKRVGKASLIPRAVHVTSRRPNEAERLAIEDFLMAQGAAKPKNRS